jgi:hypothetical protein
MTDVAIGETAVEPAPLVPPVPEAAAVFDAAPPQAEAPAAPTPPAPEESVASSAEVEPEVVESFDPRISIPESLGPVRRAVLEGLLDGEGPMSVAQLHALMPVGTPRGTAEAGILREFRSGRIMRTSPGVYKLAPARPPEAKPTPPDPPAVRSDGMTDQDWLAALETWSIDRSWDTELGPPPDQPNNIPADIKVRFNDRLRKRAERRREAEVTAAKRTAADAELRDKLIAATGGNVIRGPAIDDVTPIKLALELVSVDRVLSAVRNKTDKRMFPGNEPATSWREQRLLLEIAENYCRTEIVPRLVDAWSKAGKTPAPTAQSLPAAGDMSIGDIDELRSRHDSPSAPPGPHSLAQPDAAPDMPQEAAGASEAPAAVSAPLEQGSAPASSPPQPGAMPDDGLAIDAEPAAVDAKPPAEATRATILAAFNRNRTPASPQPASPQPRPAVRQVERPPERQAEPSISREGWEELVSGYVAGNVNWNARRLGSPPGSPDCRAPRDVLRSFGL